MDNEYKEHLGRRFKKIQGLQKIISDEKKGAGELFKDYLNSLGSFPQWLTIFSGIAGVLEIFNEIFLRVAFTMFLLSALILLYAKRSVSKKTDAYIIRLNLILERTADLTHQIVKFSRNEINENQIKEKEEKFDKQYEKMRSDIYIESTKNENTLVDWSFYLSLFGSMFLILSLLLNC